MSGLVVVYCRCTFLPGSQVLLDREGGQRRLVEAAQDKLLLARVVLMSPTAKMPGTLVWNFSVSTLDAACSMSSPQSAIGPSFG